MWRAPYIRSNEYKPWNVNGMQHVERHIAQPWAVATKMRTYSTRTHTHTHIPPTGAHLYCPTPNLLSRRLRVTPITHPVPSLTPSSPWCQGFCTLLTSCTMFTPYTPHTWTAWSVDMHWKCQCDRCTGVFSRPPSGRDTYRCRGLALCFSNVLDHVTRVI